MTARCLLVALAYAGSACLFSACQTTPPKVGAAPPGLEDDAAEAKYQAIVARYSGHAEIYGGIDSRMFANATYQSLPFREARTQRAALFQVQTPAELERHLAAERGEYEKFHDVFFAISTSNYHFDDFDKHDSIWRMVLVGPTGEVRPAAIDRVGRTSLDRRAIYPYYMDFYVGYLLRFPRTLPDGSPLAPPGTGSLLLRVASNIGKMEIKLAAE